MSSPFLIDNNDFYIGGTQHILVLLISILLGTVIITYALKKMKPAEQYRLGLNMALLVAFSEIGWMLLRLYLGVFNPAEDLPFVACHFMALMLPVLMFGLNRLLYEILYFWILGGTIQAILTPHLINGFPHYTFWMFWIVHCGLVIVILYATIVYQMRPTFRSVWKAFFVMQGYIVLSFIVNYVLDANYNYVCYKPPTASILDYLGPWPWYVVGTEGIVLCLFLIAYSPFWVMDRFKSVDDSLVLEENQKLGASQK
ncbi:MAG: TIGR02206 family membrane protein [Chitinophagales bacterium]